MIDSPTGPDFSDDTDDLKTLARTPDASEGGAFVVLVTGGPDAGSSIALDATRPRILVGQSAACTLRLRDPEVSRRHVALELAGASLRVTDLGSTNGTTVDGVTVIEVLVRGGETIRLGATTLRVERRTGHDAPPVPMATSFGRFLGLSRAVRALYPLCEQLARASIHVLIEGETGTGKEVLAESIHEQGPRANRPFVVLDCTAVPPSLLEAELFGYERGAFTGATTSRRGLFEEAEGGTLLIDEIGELDALLQPKLLRAIERKEVRRIGSNRPISVDVRVLAATRRDLDREVQAGRFRDDLFHRLAVGRIELPPLRRRTGDVTFLAGSFYRALGGGDGGVPSEVLRRWEDYAWPGNVRELYNAVSRYLAIGESAPVAKGVPASGDFLDQVLGEPLGLIAARQRVVDEFERRYVTKMLAEHGGNVAKAAAASGIARRYFQLLKARGR